MVSDTATLIFQVDRKKDLALEHSLIWKLCVMLVSVQILSLAKVYVGSCFLPTSVVTSIPNCWEFFCIRTISAHHWLLKIISRLFQHYFRICFFSWSQNTSTDKFLLVYTWWCRPMYSTNCLLSSSAYSVWTSSGSTHQLAQNPGTQKAAGHKQNCLQCFHIPTVS
jgi:hypothetical protein